LIFNARFQVGLGCCGPTSAFLPIDFIKLFDFECLGSVHISSVRKILSAKARLQGEKRSKVGHLASIFNAAGAFLSQKIVTR
jgi:hypothetical protein